MRLRPVPLTLCVAIAVVAAASLAGVRHAARAEAGTVAAATTTGPRYGLSTVGLSYPFAAAIAKGFSDAAARAGASAVVLDAKGDVQKQ
ncbi:MAG TPA: sugar ABC transporter substrate-binding protein, partial [Sphingomonas sp.]